MIPLPPIEIKINMAGIAQSMRLLTGTSFQPNDLYDVYNTARDPDGQPYFEAVNNGTGSKRGAGGRKMHYWATGRLVSTRFVGPNPAHHMRERTIPLIRQYFSDRVSGTTARKKISVYPEGMTDGKFKATYYVLPSPSEHGGMMPGYMTGTYGQSEGIGQEATLLTGKLSPTYWIQIMEDVMDYTIAMLAQFTPVLKSEYYSQDYTTEPGTLRSSYTWVRRGGSVFPPKPGSKAKRPKKFLGSAKHRLTTPSKAIAHVIESHPASRGLFTKLKRIHQERFNRPRIH